MGYIQLYLSKGLEEIYQPQFACQKEMGYGILLIDQVYCEQFQMCLAIFKEPLVSFNAQFFLIRLIK